VASEKATPRSCSYDGVSVRQAGDTEIVAEGSGAAVDAMYAVKAEVFGDWPFAMFRDLSSAIACVNAMHPDRNSDELIKLIKRVPCFKSCALLDAEEEGAVECS